MGLLNTGNRGAKALCAILKSQGYSCRRDDDTVYLEPFGIIIQFRYVYHQIQAENSAATYSVHAYVPRIRRTVHDVIVSTGAKGTDAHKKSANTFAVTTLPLILWLCGDERANDLIETSTQFVNDRRTGTPRSWTLVHGAVYARNMPPEVITTDRISKVLSDVWEPMLVDADVYWFRCFACRHQETQLSADCVLNNVMHEEGHRQLIHVARVLRGAPPMQSLKQHFLLAPEDLDASMEQLDAATTSAWTACVARHAPDVSPSLRDSILRAIKAFSAHAGLDTHHVNEALRAEGIDEDNACRLSGYIPEACARHDWESKGVTFDAHFILLNLDARTGRSGRIADDPLLMAIQRVIAALRTDKVADPILDALRDTSATQNAIGQLMESGSKPENLSMCATTIPTQGNIEGEITPEHAEFVEQCFGIRVGKNKGKWRFW